MPKKLYIAADGPRDKFPEDLTNCEKSRKIATNVNWDCDIKTLFRDNNLGCGIAVSSAIDWFFKNEECGIILEDDCLPDESFFYFCRELLKRYSNENRIMHINGNNFNMSVSKLINYHEQSSYFFGSFPQVWGWASWRRAWKHYDYRINSWSETRIRRTFLTKFPSIGTFLERSKDFTLVYKGQIDTWDFQWQYTVLLNNGVAIIPKNNLVSNFGFGVDSAHMKTFEKNRNCLRTSSIKFPLEHPKIIRKAKSLDYFFSKKMGMRPKIRNISKYIDFIMSTLA